MRESDRSGNLAHLTAIAPAAKQTARSMKPFSWFDEDALKHSAAFIHSAKQRGAVMWNIINNLYREYCLARLNEMRQYELTR